MQRKSKKQQSTKKYSSGKARAVPVMRGGGGYTIGDQAPAARGTSTRMIPNGVVITKRELVGTFVTANTNTFTLIPPSAGYPGLDVNPTNGSLFPWLSNVAPLYEKYEFSKLKFDIVSGVPTSIPGRLYMALDYDWDDPPATTSTQFMANYGAVSANLWQNLSLTVDITKLNEVVKKRYCADAIRAIDSQRLTYAGYLMLASNTPNQYNFDLYVDYTVIFTNPCLPTPSVVASVAPTPQTLGVGAAAAFLGLPVVPELPIVTSGLNGVPVLAPTLFSTALVTKAYTVPASGAGNLSFSCRDNKVGATPSSYATDTTMEAAVTDHNGAFLDYLSHIISHDLTVGQLSPSGVDTTASWGVNDGFNKRLLDVDLRALRAWLPTASYFIPYLVSGAGQVLSNVNLLARYKS